jgi:hypothetical protein
MASDSKIAFTQTIVVSRDVDVSHIPDAINGVRYSTPLLIGVDDRRSYEELKADLIVAFNAWTFRRQLKFRDRDNDITGQEITRINLLPRNLLPTLEWVEFKYAT